LSTKAFIFLDRGFFLLSRFKKFYSGYFW